MGGWAARGRSRPRCWAPPGKEAEKWFLNGFDVCWGRKTRGTILLVAARAGGMVVPLVLMLSATGSLRQSAAARRATGCSGVSKRRRKA